jgi:hypothetical protein
MEELEAQQQWQERHGYNLSKISITTPGEPPLPPLQANRLVFGQPGDKYEQEADRVAAQVVKQINAPAPQQSAFGQTLQREGISEEEKEKEQLQTKPVVTKIQRQEESDREEEEEENLAQMKLQAGVIQRQEEPAREEEEEENLAQMKPMVQRQSGRKGLAAMPDIEASIQQARSGGQPLDENVRKPIEQAFGADFGGVRIHADSQADTLNRSLQARAFTTGEDVFFRQGEYNPGSQQGQELLAHELTHVVQQVNTVQRKQNVSEIAANKTTTISHFIREPMVQGDFWNSIRRGAQMYWGVNDVGSPLAKSLMRWRIIGLGQDYVEPIQWSDFMQDRPEIQRAMATKFNQLALGFATSGGSGSFTDSITGVMLNELESMRLTLHGCHRIDIQGDYEVIDVSGYNRFTMRGPSAFHNIDNDKVVRFTNVRFIWVDKADLHPGTVTELESGETVDDREFTSAGWDYDIYIHFCMPSTSTWRVSGGKAKHERGWPPVTGAPAAGFRG